MRGYPHAGAECELTHVRPLSRQSSSSQSQPTQAPTPQGADAQNTNYGVYIQVDPLAKVRYDNRYDVSLGLAYDHMKAGPSLLQGANLGGLDGDASIWLTRNWGIEGSGRAYVGTSGTAPNDKNGNGGDLQGPVVKQYFFVGGLEWLGPHNKHGAMHGACHVRRGLRKFPERSAGRGARRISISTTTRLRRRRLSAEAST